jgi:hypothetical protein
VVGAKRKELIAIYDEVEFVESLTQGTASEGSFPWYVRSLATAGLRKRQKHALLQLAMASAVWRLVEQRVPPPLHGLRVVLTGVMLLSNGDLSTDSHAEVRALVRRLGGQGLPGGGVTKSETDVLIVGRGEKGENGKPNGKGEAAESSAKYAAALKFNTEWSERHEKRAAEHASARPDAAPDGAAGVPTFRAVVAADIPTLNQNTTGTASNVTGIVALANGGTGTATPSLVAGTNVTITGTWPNQTINASGGGGGGSSPIPKLQSWSIGAM